MDSVLTFHASHSHLFPGAVLQLGDNDQLPSHPGQSLEAVVMFSDDSVAEADLVPDAPRLRLLVQPYTTGSGTSIPAKNWLLSQDGDHGELKVSGRADEG